MVKKMNKRKRMIRGAAVFVTLAAMAVIVRAIIRKRRPRITYGPMHERDRVRFDYLDQKIWKRDVLCKNMLRFERAAFFRLCGILKDRELLEDSPHLSVEQQLAMFLHTIGHNVRNRVISANFCRSYGTTIIYFRKALHAIGELRNDYIRPPSLETPAKIAGNHRFDPYFKDCIGAIDGTHVRAGVTKDVEHSFRGRKAFTTQNVMAAVDFDLRFTYVLAGWEGSAHDATVLADALTRERGLQVPPGKFYLVDAGYGAKPGFLPPFRGVRYHLNEWGNNPVQNDRELFNLRHSSLRVTVERAFGSLKRCFKILDDAKPFLYFPVQVDIVIACCVLHNYALSQGIDEFIIPEVTWTTQPIRTTRQQAKMDNTKVTAASGNSTKSGVIVWTRAMTTTMLGFLADLVAEGKRTSSGFREAHHRQCATALNEQFKLAVTAEQVRNHLKKWRKIWGRVVILKNLSGALWDEDTCTIRLAEEHYAGHCMAHKVDAPYLNTPIEHYHAMVTIFGTTAASGIDARSGNDLLSIEVEDEENGEVNTSPNVVESSHPKGPPKKKAKVVKVLEDPLVTTLNYGFKLVADALVKSGDEVCKLGEFDEEHLAHYYAHLVDNPKIAKAFMTLSQTNKSVWVSRYVKKNF
ncbi:uncharacterized protein LOC123412823 [Hordeum vulgare subsp. vulgare]|nr:uncharacterized protein LOC123412823 [Hordeum vulgare subsp. vulgare]